MKEQLITFETAKLAKEKGLEMIKTTYAYDPSGETFHRDYIPHDFNIRGLLSAPTQSLLQKWIREKHKIHIVIIPSICNYTFKVIDVQCDPSNQIERPPYKGVDANDYQDYEAALEEGLKTALNLIKHEN